MRPRRGRWYLSLGSMLSVVLLAALAPSPAVAAEVSTLRLFGTSGHVTTVRYGKSAAWIDPGAWVTSSGGAFELRVARPDYDSPVDVVQVDPETDTVVRDLSEDRLDGWRGFTNFFKFTVRTPDGTWVASKSRKFCPNEGDRQRIHDGGPVNPVYPFYCGGHPLTRGMVWGVEDGWAVQALGWFGALRMKLKPGDYVATLKIVGAFSKALEIPKADRKLTIDLTVKQKGGAAPHPEAAQPGSQGTGSQQEGIPDTDNPDPATLPDLVAMPAFAFDTFTRKGRDVLAFAATEWNEGPGALVVEGYRQPQDPVMDAYQYFYDGQNATGRAAVGTMEYHDGGSHNHWHFEQFTRYSMLDTTQTEVVASNKQSWCLAPTDAIDLTVEGANWYPGSTGLSTACGYESAIWVREILDVGWGDTYYQYYGGQAFDITDLPNGTYYVQVQVNPTGSLYEADTSNNIELREVKLKGSAGSRRVVVPPWHGIDTES
jgi:hypothetical protein